MKQEDNRPNPSAKITFDAKPNENRPETIARASLNPSVQASFTISQYNHETFGEHHSLDKLVSELEEHCKMVNAGDLSPIKARLTGEINSLDTLFNNLARRAFLAEDINIFEKYLRLALKVQSQCHATARTLGELVNPSAVAFVRQANIAKLYK